jgi:hypothetical protein
MTYVVYPSGHEAEALMREDRPEWRPSMGRDFSKTWLWLDMNIR